MSEQKHRPTHKELNGKLKFAREAVEGKRYFPAVPTKLLSNFSRLKLYSFEDQYNALISILDEINPVHYEGNRPPPKSYEPGAVYGVEMFAFAWNSQLFKKRMYFKFSLVPDASGVPSVYIYSLHQEQLESKRS